MAYVPYRKVFAAHHERQRSRTLAQMDEIAELVAEGDTVTTASHKMGFTPERGSQLWCRIRRGLNVPVRD